MQVYNNNGVQVYIDVPSTESRDQKAPHVRIRTKFGEYNHVYLEASEGGEYNIWYSWKSFGRPVIEAIDYCQSHANELKDIYYGR